MGKVLYMPALAECHGAKLDDNGCVRRPVFALTPSDGEQRLSCGRHVEALLILLLDVAGVVEVKAYSGN